MDDILKYIERVRFSHLLCLLFFSAAALLPAIIRIHRYWLQSSARLPLFPAIIRMHRYWLQSSARLPLFPAIVRSHHNCDDSSV